MTLLDPENQEMNGQFKVTWIMLHIISQYIMVHERFLEACIYFELMYTIDHIFPFILIKDLINKYRKPNNPFKLATVTKLSVSHLCLSFCQFIVRKATAHIDQGVLNMRHKAQKSFLGRIQQHQKRYLVYVTSTRKIISSYDIIFDDFFTVR